MFHRPENLQTCSLEEVKRIPGLQRLSEPVTSSITRCFIEATCCQFFKEVANHLESNESCHMHFRDSSDSWTKQSYIDVAVDVENT